MALKESPPPSLPPSVLRPRDSVEGGISSGAGRWAALSNRGINGACGRDINLASFVVVLEAIWQLCSLGNELVCASWDGGRRRGKAEWPAGIVSRAAAPKAEETRRVYFRPVSSSSRGSSQNTLGGVTLRPEQMITALNGKTNSKYL